MKKVISGLLCIALVGVLSGCSSNGEMTVCKVEQESMKVDVYLKSVDGAMTEMKTVTTLVVPDKETGEILRTAAEQTKVEYEKYPGLIYEYSINDQTAVITSTYDIKKIDKSQYEELGFTDQFLTDGKLDEKKFVELYNLSGIQCESAK